jgi:hypothetical protein
MRRLAVLLLPLSVCALAGADETRRPILLLHRDFPAASMSELTREADARGLEVAAPDARPEPASETLLADVRPLWRDMAWAKAGVQLDEAVDRLIRGREPTPGVVRALAEIELWRGACRLLARDAAGAADHFVLARSLWPEARLEPIFPPKVHAAFKAARAERPVPVDLRIAPTGARLWLDGRAVESPLSASPGLHYAVLTRADLQPMAQVVRITRSAAQVSMSLREPAAPADALRAARWWPGERATFERPVLLVSVGNGRWRAGEPAIEAADAAHLVTEICQRHPGCTALPAPTVEHPAVADLRAAPPPPPEKPVWKRAWFWGVVGASVVVLAGVATGAALGATLPRDYVVRVR